jgi:hypothetical protein
MLIHEHSHGIPRTISVLCDNALVSGMALGSQPVTRTIVAEVCRDFRLTASGQAASHPQQLRQEPFEPLEEDAAEDGSVESAADPTRPVDLFRRNRNRLGALVSPLRGGRMIT